MKRKLLASILALCMVLTLCPVTAFAEEGDHSEETVASDIDEGDTAQNSEETEASGITVTLEALETAAEGKVKLTIVYDNSPDTVALYYKIVDKAPATPNVGVDFNSDGFKAYTAVVSEFAIANGQYVVAYGVTENKVVAYGVSAPSDDGYTAQNPEVTPASGITVTLEALETAAEGKVKLTIVYDNSPDAVVLYYKIVDKAPEEAPNVGVDFNSDGFKAYTAVVSEFAIANGQYVVAYGVTDGKVVAYGVSDASDDGYTAQNPEEQNVKVTFTATAVDSKAATITVSTTAEGTYAAASEKGYDVVKSTGELYFKVEAPNGYAIKAVNDGKKDLSTEDGKDYYKLTGLTEDTTITVTIEAETPANPEVVEGLYRIQYKYTGEVDVTALPDAYQDTTGKASEAEVIAAIVELVNKDLKGFKAVTAADVTISKQVATVTLVKEVKVEPDVGEVKDGTVTATVSTDVANSITEETEALTITATTSGSETVGTTNVALPAAVVGALANAATENENVTVDVQTNAANVTLTSDALKQISDVAGGQPVALNVTNSADKDGVTDSAVTAENSETFGVAVKVDGEEKTISGLHEKPMTLAFKLGTALQAKLASSKPVVFWIDRTGTSPVLRRMGGVKFENGAVSFKTSHFSEYIVMNEEDAKSVKATPTEITVSKPASGAMQDFTVGGYDYYSDCGFKLYVQVKFGDAVAITDRNADTGSINVTGKVNSAVEVFEVENTISYNADGSVSTSYLGYGKSA